MAFPNGSIRSSHYVKTPQGSKHDADIVKLERAHKAHHDLGMNTEPDQHSHNPNQENYEHDHPSIVSPTIGAGGSSPLEGLD
jgi:hypothetical protein